MTTPDIVATQPLPVPPKAPGLPFIGNAVQFLSSSGIPVEYMHEVVKKHGDFVHFKVMNQSLYVVANPDLVHEVLVKRANDFQKTQTGMEKSVGLGRFLGNGILTANQDEWKPQRKLIQPLMHTKHIQSYALTMAQYGEQLLDSWFDGSVRDIHVDMTQVTMWIIGKTMLGIDVDQTKDIEECAITGQKIAVADFSSPLPSWLTTGRNHEAAKTNDKLTELAHLFMAQAETERDSERYDLLSLLMETRDEDGNPVSDEFIRDNILTLFFAGHETTANTLTWTFYYLDQNPEVAAELQKEVDTVLGGRLPTLEDLPNLPYTMMVVKETMRIQPTVSAFPRVIMHDTDLGGYQLKAGGLIFIPPYILHHDERWWDNPAEFDPTRFSAENEPNIPKYAYLPFGGGPRVCIGNHFSLMEAQILLALIASRYELRLVEGTKVEPLRLITTAPKGGLPMRLKRR